MKNSIYYMLIGLFLLSCEDDVDPIDPITDTATVDVNFYLPNEAIEEESAPQLTIKNDEIQVTALGFNKAGVQEGIDKLYISDTETQTEWIVLVDEEAHPKFLYAINSFSHERLPFLYWLETKTESEYTIRYYDYDWANRLGTLQYEAEVINDDVNVIFDNVNLPEGGRIASEAGKKAKRSKAFPAPVIEFDNYRPIASTLNQSIKSDNVDETLDEQFDRQVNDLLSLLKETKTKLISAPCNVSKILNKSDKNFVCKLSDQLNKVTDEEIFKDISEATDETQSGDNFEFEGNEVDLDIDFYDDSNIFDNILRHLNDVRDKITDSFDLDEWFLKLAELAEVETEDLNDLSDSSGVLQVGLSWNTTADIDLHVIDPLGEEISFENTSSASGGYLDLDDTDGYGPENIYWTKDIPDGKYTVTLVYYDPEGGPITDYTVRVINGLGVEQSFVGSLGYFDHNSISIVSFTKEGNILKF